MNLSDGVMWKKTHKSLVSLWSQHCKSEKTVVLSREKYACKFHSLTEFLEFQETGIPRSVCHCSFILALIIPTTDQLWLLSRPNSVTMKKKKKTSWINRYYLRGVPQVKKIIQKTYILCVLKGVSTSPLPNRIKAFKNIFLLYYITYIPSLVLPSLSSFSDVTAAAKMWNMHQKGEENASETQFSLA